VDLVADAHRLPFRDDSVPAAVCETVLEHVAEPDRIIGEAHRVLKPGGHFFFIVPFVFPFHGQPNDFQRWSREGLRQAFAAFDEVEVGIHGGPCSALVNLLSEWAFVVTGLRFPRGYVAIKGLATALLFPLKFLDLIANRLPEAHRMAATLYVSGRK
jgi:SAM-dependent methyltransferase